MINNELPKNHLPESHRRISGNLYDDPEKTQPVNVAAIQRGLSEAGIRAVSIAHPEAAPNRPVTGQEFLEQERARMRQFGQTDEQLAYQPGRPRPAVTERPATGVRRRPRQADVEADDVFFENATYLKRRN